MAEKQNLNAEKQDSNMTENGISGIEGQDLYGKMKPVEAADGSLTDEQRLKQLAEPLLYWFNRNKRDLPWRREPTPYHVWLSEIMLQQTRVEAVIPYYNRFLERLPDIKALAQVDRISSSFRFLLMTSRSRWVPASGAKVKPLFRTVWSFSISSLEKLSARREGTERLMRFPAE